MNDVKYARILRELRKPRDKMLKKTGEGKSDKMREFDERFEEREKSSDS